ncbi:13929_t:CDS:1, partial [Acaulospora morrowiae]
TSMSKRSGLTSSQLKEITKVSEAQREINKIPFKDQRRIADLSNEHQDVQVLLRGLLELREFDDIKTTLTLREFLNLSMNIPSGH